MLHIGVDEAGYGPLLGPLVVAAALYRTDRPRASIPGRGIADSKLVYRRGGRAALGRVLGPYLGLGRRVTLTGLLAARSVRGDPRPVYPWYRSEVGAEVGLLAAAPPEFAGLFLNPVCAREFNAGCRRTGGKGLLLFEETMRVVRAALEAAPGEDALVICDKQGGRHRYAALLLDGLRPSALLAEREGPASSDYRLALGGRTVRIRFVRQADATDRPAGLASMAAKFTRELFLEGLNAFFAARVRGLRPTAGYVEDGRRFLRDVKTVVDGLDCPGTDLVRMR